MTHWPQSVNGPADPCNNSWGEQENWNYAAIHKKRGGVREKRDREKKNSKAPNTKARPEMAHPLCVSGGKKNIRDLYDPQASCIESKSGLCLMGLVKTNRT